MRRVCLATACAALLAMPASAGATTTDCTGPPSVCTTLRFVQQCAPIVVEEVKQTIASGKPQTIACPV